jgi:hypothetical protein
MSFLIFSMSNNILAFYNFKPNIGIVNINSLYITPQLFGTYLLRTTNNCNIKSKYTYLIINDNTNIKIKTIEENGFIATKTSKRGIIDYIPSINNINSYLFKKNSYDVLINFNNINKYSYSYFGIEFPEIKYKEITNYKSKIRIRLEFKQNSIVMMDENKYYYIFDLYPSIKINKLPYIEMPFNTFLFSQFLGFIINIIFVKFLDSYTHK